MNGTCTIAVSLGEKEDRGAGRTAHDLQAKEDGVPLAERVGADQQSAEEPHRPGPAADARGAKRLREVAHLRDIRER